MSRLSNSTTRALREPLPVLTLVLTRHVGCTAGIYRRLWPLQMTPVRTTNGAMPTSSRARQRRRGSSAKPGAIADIDPRPRLPAETRSDGARSEVRAGDGMRGSNACVDRTLARQRVVSRCVPRDCRQRPTAAVLSEVPRVVPDLHFPHGGCQVGHGSSEAVGAEAGAGLVVVEADGCGAVQQWWLEGLQAPVANGAAAAVTNT